MNTTSTPKMSGTNVEAIGLRRKLCREWSHSGHWAEDLFCAICAAF